MILKLILQAICCFTWFCCGVAAYDLYMKKQELKKAMQDSDVVRAIPNYWLFYIDQGFHQERILSKFYNGVMKLTPNKCEEEFASSIRLLSEKQRLGCVGYFVIANKENTVEMCIYDLSYKLVMSFFVAKMNDWRE